MSDEVYASQLVAPSTILPASPNWFMPNACDLNSAFFAIACRSSVTLMRTANRTFIGNLIGHTDRVTGVSIRHRDNLIVTTSVDKSVRLWNANTQNCIGCVSDAHDSDINALSVSQLDHVCVSGDKKGTLVCWDFASILAGPQAQNKVQVYQNLAGRATAITAVACSPHDASVCAVGFLTGQLLIVDVRDGRVLHRLAGHEDDIQTLAWRNFALPVQSPPSASDTVADSWRQSAVTGFLLASTSKDRTVRVWDIKSDGADLHCQLSLPKSNAFGGGSAAQNRARPLWFACAWSPSQPTKLLSTGPQGEVFELDIDQKRVTHTLAPSNVHNRIVFSLAAVSAPLINTDVALSIGMDRNIVLWDLTSRKSLWSMPSFGAYVYTHCPAPWSPRVFALALGDNMIGIWNTATVSKKKDVVTDQSLISHQVAMIWKGVQAKVVSLCWHPTQEGCLAFGTEDGRVALVDSSTHHISRPCQFRTQIFELGFARPPSTSTLADASKSEQTSMFLFCLCEDGQLFQISLSDSMQPLLLNLPTANPESAGNGRKIKKTGFSWSADFGLFCIGLSDGSVMMYSASLSDAGNVEFGLHATLHDQTSTVYRIRFHPRFAESEFRFIATASADGTVVVYDVSTYLFKQPDAPSSTFHYSNDQNNVACRLRWHRDTICDLQWCPHSTGRIATAAFDRSVVVWDIEAQLTKVSKDEPCPMFVLPHSGRVLSVSWWPMQPNRISTTSDDQTVKVWELNNMEVLPPGFPNTYVNKKYAASKPKNSVKPAEKDTVKATAGVELDSVVSPPQTQLEAAPLPVLPLEQSSIVAVEAKSVGNQISSSSAESTKSDVQTSSVTFAAGPSATSKGFARGVKRSETESIADAPSLPVAVAGPVKVKESSSTSYQSKSVERKARGLLPSFPGGSDSSTEAAMLLPLAAILYQSCTHLPPASDAFVDSVSKLWKHMSFSGISSAHGPDMALFLRKPHFHQFINSVLGKDDIRVSEISKSVPELADQGVLASYCISSGTKSEGVGSNYHFGSQSLSSLDEADSTCDELQIDSNCRFRSPVNAAGKPLATLAHSSTGSSGSTSLSSPGLGSLHNMVDAWNGDFGRILTRTAGSGRVQWSAEHALMAAAVAQPAQVATPRIDTSSAPLRHALVALAEGHEAAFAEGGVSGSVSGVDSLHSAVRAYLIAGLVHPAIELYERYGLFADAAALALCRLPRSDPHVLRVYSQWAAAADEKHFMLLAARLYLAAMQPLAAIELLSRRHHSIVRTNPLASPAFEILRRAKSNADNASSHYVLPVPETTDPMLLRTSMLLAAVTGQSSVLQSLTDQYAAACEESAVHSVFVTVAAVVSNEWLRVSSKMERRLLLDSGFASILSADSAPYSGYFSLTSDRHCSYIVKDYDACHLRIRLWQESAELLSRVNNTFRFKFFNLQLKLAQFLSRRFNVVQAGVDEVEFDSGRALFTAFSELNSDHVAQFRELLKQRAASNIIDHFVLALSELALSTENVVAAWSGLLSICVSNGLYGMIPIAVSVSRMLLDFVKVPRHLNFLSPTWTALHSCIVGLADGQNIEVVEFNHFVELLIKSAVANHSLNALALYQRKVTLMAQLCQDTGKPETDVQIPPLLISPSPTDCAIVLAALAQIRFKSTAWETSFDEPTEFVMNWIRVNSKSFDLNALVGSDCDQIRQQILRHLALSNPICKNHPSSQI